MEEVLSKYKNHIIKNGGKNGDTWIYGNSDGSGPDVYYDKKKDVITYGVYKADIEEYFESIVLSYNQFNTFIKKFYKSCCDNMYH